MSDPMKEVFGVESQESESTQDEQTQDTQEPTDGDQPKPKEVVYGAEEPPDAGEPEEEPRESEDKKRAAFYQTRHQQTMDALKRLDPTIYNAVRDSFKETPKEEPHKEVVLDDDAMVDPAELLRVIRNIPNTIQEATRKVQQEAILRDRSANEQTLVNQTLATFIKENQIPKEDFDAAVAEVRGLGINTDQLGGPTAFGRALIKELQFNALVREWQGGSTELESKAAEKVKAMAAVAQPDAAATPAPKTKKSKEEELVESMKLAGANKATREVFG